MHIHIDYIIYHRQTNSRKLAAHNVITIQCINLVSVNYER